MNIYFSWYLNKSCGINSFCIASPLVISSPRALCYFEDHNNKKSLVIWEPVNKHSSFSTACCLQGTSTSIHHNYRFQMAKRFQLGQFRKEVWDLYREWMIYPSPHFHYNGSNWIPGSQHALRREVQGEVCPADDSVSLWISWVACLC